MSKPARSHTVPAERLLRVLNAIQSPNGQRLETLAKAHGVSKRTLRRDLAMLQEAGFDVERTESGEFRLAFGHGRLGGGRRLSPAEILGLALLRQAALPYADQPYFRDGVAGIDKILASAADVSARPTYPPGNLPYVSIAGGPLPAVPESDHPAELIEEAIRLTRRCRLWYWLAAADGTEVIDFEPYHLHFCSRGWYVVGRCVDEDSWRVLKILRVRDAQMLPEKFQAPTRAELDRFVAQRWSPGDQDGMTNVTLIFSPLVAEAVLESRWHPSQRDDRLPDGRLRVSFRLAGVTDMLGWVLGFGDQVEVIEPVELRTMVCEVARRVARRYERDTGF